MNKEDIYQLLSISEKTTPEFVKKAFKNFAKANHPDFFPGDRLREERFKRVTSAYQNWKLIQSTVNQIRRLRTRYETSNPSGFKPWSFSYKV
jgi:curved DNA-binding protein CbpA